MSRELEALILDAFAGLGSRRSLANGNFRLVAGGGETCAVYFSGNAPGNAVEIGLSPRVIAPLLGRTERALKEWLDRHDAAHRERTRSGQRGSYPDGLAFGSRRELVAFLAAWADFRNAGGAPASVGDQRPDALVVTRVEKAAQDAGFDLTPVWRGGWLVFRSSAFTDALAVQVPAADVFRVGMENMALAEKVAADCGLPRSTGDWPAIFDPVSGYEALYALLQRTAAVARLLAGEGAAVFRQAAAVLPATTEAERLVVQRVGQDIFRQSLIDYWQGRCAVTGLDVVPLLRASHIKRWADCANDAERLDVYNGLLLAPHLDALFDGGWISFDDAGRLLVCADLSGEQRALLGLDASWRLREIAHGHRRYMEWHRRWRFKDAQRAA